MTPAAMRTGGFVALLTAAAGLAVWLAWPRAPSPEPPDAGAQPPVSEFRGVTVVEEESDGTRWTLSAAAGAGWESERTGSLTRLSAVFERRGRRVEVTAGRGDASGGQTLILSDGVEVSWDRFTARTERAVYNRGEGLIRSEAPLKLVGPGIEVTGTGFQVDVEGRKGRVLSGVRAVLGGPKS